MVKATPRRIPLLSNCSLAGRHWRSGSWRSNDRRYSDSCTRLPALPCMIAEPLFCSPATASMRAASMYRTGRVCEEQRTYDRVHKKQTGSFLLVHIEQRRLHYKDYPMGTMYQPERSAAGVVRAANYWNPKRSTQYPWQAGPHRAAVVHHLADDIRGGSWRLPGRPQLRRFSVNSAARCGIDKHSFSFKN